MVRLMAARLEKRRRPIFSRRVQNGVHILIWHGCLISKNRQRTNVLRLREFRRSMAVAQVLKSTVS
jgi:hypothetical protein